MGGNRPRLLEGEREWLVARLAATPDLTLRALVVELRARGVTASYGSVWRTLRRAGISFKKNAVHRFDDRWISAARGDVSYELDRQDGNLTYASSTTKDSVTTIVIGAGRCKAAAAPAR